MTKREQQVIQRHMEQLQAVAQEIRDAAAQLHEGKLNQWRAAKRFTKLADRLVAQGGGR